jgi:hypothetical protein
LTFSEDAGDPTARGKPQRDAARQRDGFGVVLAV